MNIKSWYFLIISMVLLFACKEAYNPPLVSPVTGYLVVEGFINSGNGASTITLTRTTKLIDSVAIIYENGAQVMIEAENGASYPLYESSSGTYVSDNLLLNQGAKYRIHINTFNGSEYVSDFAPATQTPPIDSISWQLENGGVRIYVNARDPQNDAKYYQYKYSETWEFHSPFVKRLEYVRDAATNQIVNVVPLNMADTTMYRCWKTQHSSNIILASTEQLREDKVYHPIRYIAPQGEELSTLYYITVKQYALSREGYLFKQRLKKNTEQLGSIFDAQPSALGGNIRCVTNPAEIVIGYVEVTGEQETHLFIPHSLLENWPTQIPCSQQKYNNAPGEFDASMIPTEVAEYRGLAIATFYAADPLCVDCTLRGSNIKPPFWP